MLAGLLFSSCIREEALNAEADITGVTVDGPTLIRRPVITNDEVIFYVNGWEDLTRLSPQFTVTEGATIEPASGTEHDFTQPQSYTVTSQDRQWKKTYKVSFVSDDVATEYHFDEMNGTSTGILGIRRLLSRSCFISSSTRPRTVTISNGGAVMPASCSLPTVLLPTNTRPARMTMATRGSVPSCRRSVQQPLPPWVRLLPQGTCLRVHLNLISPILPSQPGLVSLSGRNPRNLSATTNTRPVRCLPTRS